MTRRLTLLISGILGLSVIAEAQSTTLFNTSETLNAGNISAPHFVHGDLWWNTSNATSALQFPKGVSNQVSGVSAIWMGGRDAMNQLKVAAQTYRSKGAGYELNLCGLPEGVYFLQVRSPAGTASCSFIHR